MSSKKISELTALETSVDADVVVIVDVSTNETKKQTKVNLLKDLVSDTAYAIGWNGDTTHAASKNAIYDKIETLPGGHDAVTLDANAETLLSLSTQELGLDTQTANKVFAGPASGAVAVPTFRDLVAADIPDLSAVYAVALGVDDNYVTDAEKIVIGNTSGANTGDQDLSSYAPLVSPSLTGIALITNTSAGALITQVRHLNSSNTVGSGGRVSFRMLDSNSAVQSYGRIATEIDVATAGSEDGTMRLSVIGGGVFDDLLILDGSSKLATFAGGITATGAIAGSNLSGSNTGDNTVCTSGTATTAATLATPRTIAGVSFDGSANISLNNNAITNGAGYTTNTGDLVSGGALGTPSSGTLTNCTFPTLNQNTTGSSGSCTGNSATVTNATLTTALTVNTGTLTLIANVANTSVLTIGAGAVSVSGSNTGDNTVCTSGTATTAATLATGRDINGVSFNGSANITVTAAAGTLTGTTLKSTVITSSLTTVGTIGTGVWEGTDIGIAHGGTGASTLAGASIPTYTSTTTFTNKRITARVTTEASSATPTINTNNSDMHSITALAAAITSMTTNLSGTPTNGQKLIIRILDNGTGRAITWGASFEDNGVALPSTTTASKLLSVGFIYDTVSSKWGCVAVADET